MILTARTERLTYIFVLFVKNSGHVAISSKPCAVWAIESALTGKDKKYSIPKRDFVLGYDFDGENRTVDVHIRTLRQKLGSCGDLIETVRGVGYRIRAYGER